MSLQLFTLVSKETRAYLAFAPIAFSTFTSKHGSGLNLVETL